MNIFKVMQRMAALVVLLLCFGGSFYVRAAQVFELLEREGLIGVEESAARAAEAAAQRAATETFGAGAAEELAKLPERAVENFRAQLTEIVKANPALSGAELQAELASKMKPVFDTTIKPAIIESKGVGLPEGFAKRFQFSEAEIASMQRGIVPAPGIEMPGGAALRAEAGSIGDLETQLGQARSEHVEARRAIKPGESTPEATRRLQEAQANIDRLQRELKTARAAETRAVELKEAAVVQEQAQFVAAQEAGELGAIEGAQAQLADAQSAAQNALDGAKQGKIQSAKTVFEDAKSDLEQAIKNRETAKTELGKETKGTDAYKAAAEKLERAEAEVTEAATQKVNAERAWKDIEYDTLNWRQKKWYDVKSFVVGGIKELAQQLVIGTIFLVPGWAQQTFAETMNKKALSQTLEKNQRFGKIWMTLPRCFVNEENPAASLYVYVGLSEKNTNQTYTGSEESLQKDPVNLYVAAPSYGEWGSVALTDPNFPNAMAHLNTGFVFVGDGAPANTACPALQLIGEKSKYPSCTGVLQNDKLNKLYGPIHAGVAGTIAEGQFIMKASGYEGSAVIAGLLDPETNKHWKDNYPSLQPEMHYGSLLNVAIGGFQDPIKVGDWMLQGIQGLGAQFSQLIKDAKGADKKPYVAEGIWVYQSGNTQRAATVRNQLLANAESATSSQLVWDYIVALDDKGAPIPLHAVKATENGFQVYGLSPHVKYLCSLLQEGILGAKGAFMIYDLDGKKMINSTFASPLEQDTDFKRDFEAEVPLKAQVQTMYQFIKTEMVKGPFMIGPKKLEITQELLDANLPVYRIAGGLEDGSDDYVYPTDAGGNGVTLPSDNVKFIWSLVTSRAYIPTDFGPYTTNWYVDVTKNDQGVPVGIKSLGGSDKAGPYKGPLATLLLPQDFNLIKTDDGTPLPVPYKYILNAFPSSAKSLSKAPAIKIVADAIDTSLTRWKAYMTEAKLAGNLEAISMIMSPKTWGSSSSIVPIQFTATSMADIVNGFYIYTSSEYPSEYVVMSDKPQFDSSTGSEFANQDYAISLSTGKVYQKTNAQGETGKFVSSVDQETLWEQLKSKVNFPTILAAQKDEKRKQQMQQNFTRLDDEIKNSQGLVNAKNALEQYGNNVFNGLNFFINKKDLAAKSYFYQDATGIQDPLNNLDAQGDIKAAVPLFVFGVTNAQGVTEWGYPLTGAADRALNLATGGVYGRGGFLGEYAQLTVDASGQLDASEYLKIVLTAVANKGMTLRDALRAKLSELVGKTVELLKAEKEAISALETAEQAKLAALQINGGVLADVVAAKYIDNYSNLVQKYLKFYKNKYYLAEVDANETIVSITDYNVAGECITYHAKTGAILMRVTGWAADNARARAGVVVAPSGAQSLAIGVDQPKIPMDGMQKLATVPVGGAATVENLAAPSQQEIDALTAALKAFKPGGDNSALLKTQAKLTLDKLLYESTQELKIAIANGDVKASSTVGYEYYFNKSIGAFFCKYITGDKAYFIDLSSGLTYETNGTPRMRRDQIFVDAAAGARAMPWFEGESRSRQLMAVLPTAAQSKTYGIYVSTVQIPPDTFVPSAGMAGVTFNNQDAIQQTSTNISDPSDDKTVVTNDYVRGQNKNVTMMHVWNMQDGKQVKIGAFTPSATEYFAHLMYIQTRAAGTAPGSFDPAAVKADDNFPAILVWNGGDTLDFKQIYYEYSVNTTDTDGSKLQIQEGQFVTLNGSGNTYTGSFTDSQGTARTVTVKKEEQTIAQAKDGKAQVTALWMSITEGSVTRDYRYDTAAIEPEKLRQVKNNWGINVVADMYGQTRLALKYTSLKAVTSVTGIPEGPTKPAITASMQQALSNIMFDGGMNRFLYKLTTDKAKAYGLKSYETTMQNCRVDLESGIVFGLDAYPIGKALSMADMQKLVTNLKVGITRDTTGKAVGLHYRNIEDVGK